ncbi:hypothetical protein PV396_26995 [Streptomyces sp. ME02-8801-2C]|uniref:hypothetical protein n=1 Tax=Streptomyces sp. ME02-8801-2C TaxID=3028680 RepID=UPI0029A94D77|nr:hypothetical protein [Streptomyces sp. ME02-8801-2C]MDX3455539.1 hypothetical protein [Streptomyces sp. ME02-8801-2C]
MIVVYWLVIALCGVVGTTFLRFAGRSWREGHSYAYRMRLVPYSDDFKKGIERAFGTVGAFHWVAALLMATVLLTPASLTTWEAGLLGALLVALLTGMALTLSIIWFNRPRFLVPPHMRTQRGTARARAAGRRCH